MLRKSNSVPIIFWNASHPDIRKKATDSINKTAASAKIDTHLFKIIAFGLSDTFGKVLQTTQEYHTGTLCVYYDALSEENKNELKLWIWNYSEQTTAMNGAWYVILLTNMPHSEFSTINRFVQFEQPSNAINILRLLTQTALVSYYHRQIDMSWIHTKQVNKTLEHDLNAYQQSLSSDIRNTIFYELNKTLLVLRRHKGIPQNVQDEDQPIQKDAPDLAQQTPSMQKLPVKQKIYISHLDSPDDQLWEVFRDELVYAAQRLWKDPIISPGIPGDQQIFTTHLTTAQRSATYSKRLLFWWLEAHLYILRCQYNHQIYENVILESLNIRAEVQKRIQEFMHIIHIWQKESTAIVKNAVSQAKSPLKKNWFLLTEGDFSYLESIAREFGIDKLDTDEMGWSSYARATNDELLYHSKQLLLFRTRQKGNSNSGVLSFILWASTGFGYRLGRFWGSIGALFAVFLGIYTFGSQFSDAACNIRPTLPSILHATFTNLIGFYTVPQNCSMVINITTYIEPFAGYFLLATLAAILAESLINAER